jgi:hypothetical protein
MKKLTDYEIENIIDTVLENAEVRGCYSVDCDPYIEMMNKERVILHIRKKIEDDEE